MVLGKKKMGCGYIKRHKGLFMPILLAVSALSLAGCAVTEENNGDIVILDQDTLQVEYSLATVTIGDVIKTEKIKCVYTQTEEEDIYFALDGKRVAKVYVKEGDSVTRGQLLAELSGGQRQDEIRALEYEIARNTLLLNHTTENVDYQISNQWVWYLYQSGMSANDKERLDAAIESIQQNSRYSLEDYQDAIEMAQLKLDALLEEEKNSYVYAGMDGKVTDLKTNLAGSTSDTDTVIMTIIDDSECLFEAEQMEYREYFTPDTELSLSIVSGVGAGQYTLIPWNMEEWDEKMYFSLVESTGESVIEVGAFGSASFVGNKREQVLTVPVQALHRSDGRTFVYVLGDNNIREVRFVEIGLEGDTNAEVLSGLTEGEVVILK